MSAPSYIHVVEDDAGVRDALLFLFESEGYRVRTYSAAEELLAVSLEPPACIITDLMLARMDGLILLEQLQERNALAPVIVITGYGDVSRAVTAMKHGAFEFVEKPYRPDLLVRCVGQALELSRRLAAAQADWAAAQDLLHRLTPRERQIFDRLVDGLPNKAIAHDLAISDRTVESHRASITRKLGVFGLAGLIALNRRAGAFAEENGPAIGNASCDGSKG